MIAESQPLQPAVFLDRDGTLMEEVNYCADPAHVRVFPGAGAALKRMRAHGFLTVIITNQSGIGRGLLTETDFHAVQDELFRQLNAELPTYFCPDAPPTPSSRRKPEPGMVLEAARDLGIDLARSWFIGDKAVDIECGHRAGTRTILVQTGYGGKEMPSTVQPDYVARDVADAAEFLFRIVLPRPRS